MAVSDTIQRFKNAATGTSGSKRMLIVVPSAAALAGAMFYLSASEQAAMPSNLPNAPAVQTVQGKVAPTVEMRNALSHADDTRVREASEQGTSAIPTVVVAPAVEIEAPQADRFTPEALDLPPRPEPPVIQPPVVAPPPLMPVQVQPQIQPEADPLVAQFAGQLQGLRMAYPAADVKYYAKGGIPPADLSGRQAQVPGRVAAAMLDPASGIKLPLPGSIVYAEMISTANSDSPGPVVARIVQGELAGATLIGSFQAQRDALFVSFQTLSMERTRDGEEINKAIPINAVAVDSRNIGSGLASSVDRHLLQNVGIAAAAAFAQGLGQAIASSGQVYERGILGIGGTVVNPVRSTRDQLYIAGGVAGGAAGAALSQAYGNRPATVTLASGTPVGILFLSNGNQ